MNTPTPSHEEISRRAQEIWRERGCPEGRDSEIWLEAERQLTSAAQTASAATNEASTSADGGANVAAPAVAQTSLSEGGAKSETKKKATRSSKGAGKGR